MEMIYCPNCAKLVGFKRALGFGTLFMALLTFGVWLLVIPFYPARCINCGLARSSAFWENLQNNPRKAITASSVTALIVGVLLAWVFLFHRNERTNSAVEQDSSVQKTPLTPALTLHQAGEPESPEPAVIVTFPERTCEIPVVNLRGVDFKNFRYPMNIGTQWAMLTDGASSDQSLVNVWYFNDGIHVLVSLDYTGGPESQMDEGSLLLFELRNANLVNTQAFEYDRNAPGTGVSFDPSSGRLIVDARSNDGSAVCCPEHLDVVEFDWNGNGRHFQQMSTKTIPVQQ